MRLLLFAVGERERRRVLVFGRRGGIVGLRRLCGGATRIYAVTHDTTTAYNVPARRGQPLSLFARPQTGAALRALCCALCALTRCRRVLGVLNLAAGIAQFQDCVAET